MWYELFVVTATLTGVFATTTYLAWRRVMPALNLAMPILVEIGEVINEIDRASPEGMGRKPEGTVDKILWFVMNTEQGQAIAKQFLGNFGGGGGYVTP